MFKNVSVVLAAFVTVLIAAPAGAQATRTWVSGVGDDVNPCSRTAPCKTFAGAIAKTAANGEINCLDSGGFGSLIINKSIAIVCDPVEAGVTAAGSGIVVNLGTADDWVVLSGLDILGVSPGATGVRMVGQGSLQIRNSKITGFRGGAGVAFQPTGSATLIIIRSTISGNQTGIAASGVGSNQVMVGDTVIVANKAGITATGGASIVSFGNNIVAGNGSDGKFASSRARP
jgi:hypothetical protein